MTKKNVQNVDSAKMRDFSHISKKEFFHFFLRFSIFIIVIIIEDKSGLKIESRKILRFSNCQPRIIGIYFYTNLFSTIFLQEQ